jgi:bacterioferritin-associated ferredoxin
MPLIFFMTWMIIILMFICICNAITERQVKSAVADGALTLSDLQGQLGVATCCGCCAETASEYLPGGRYADELVLQHEAGTLVTHAANDATLDVAASFVAVAIRRA